MMTVRGIVLCTLAMGLAVALLSGCAPDHIDEPSPSASSQEAVSSTPVQSSSEEQEAQQAGIETYTDFSQATPGAGGLAIIHTDIGGSIKAARLNPEDEADGVLGVAAVAALAHDYEASGYETLLIESGDALTGSELSMLTNGQAVVQAMNLAGYDAAGLGEGDFCWGADALVDLSDEADFNMLAANVVRGEGSSPVLRAHRVFDYSNLKVGVFGLCSPETSLRYAPLLLGNVRFLAGDQLYECAQGEIDYLRAQGCDLVVCIGRLGTGQAASGNSAEDVIGHTSGIDLFVTGAAGLAEAQQVGNTLLVEAGPQLSNIGVVLVDDGTLASNIVEFGTYDGIDSDVSAAVHGMEQDALETLEANVGTAQSDVTHAVMARVVQAVEGVTDEDASGNAQAEAAAQDNADAPSAIAAGSDEADDEGPVRIERETPLGDLVADAVLWQARQALGDGATVDAAIVPSGLIAGDLPQGPIALKDVLGVLPFGQRVCTIQVSGTQLQAALGAATAVAPNPTANFPQVAGIAMTLDAAAAFSLANPGSRVAIEDVGGRSFSADDTYVVATFENTAAGSGAYTAFSRIDSRQFTGTYDFEALAGYIKSLPDATVGQSYSQAAERVLVAVE